MLTWPQTESVVVFARDNHVLHAGGLRDRRPAVGVAGEIPRLGVGRRRRAVEHPARNANAPFGVRDLGLELDDARRADGGGMHIGQVRRVEHIVGDQPIVALEMRHVGRRRLPVLVVEPPDRGDFRLVGRLVAHPDPNTAVFLDDGISAHLRVRRDLRLAGNIDAGAEIGRAHV